MAVDVKVPALGESVTEATVAKWLKKVGDAVKADEPICELETDKVTMAVNSPSAGTLSEILVAANNNVKVGAVVARIADGVAAAKVAAAPAPAAAPTTTPLVTPNAGPAVRRVTTEQAIDPAAVVGTGKDGRVTKADVIQYMDKATPMTAPQTTPQIRPTSVREERVKMSRLRQRIAERLKAAQNTAAMLTTFNEIDMSAAQALREQYRDSFEKRHGIKLGFMSFFVKAAVAALREFPAVNAEINGDDIIYKNYYDIGVAVGTDQGLVVPVLRDADQHGFATIEKQIAELGKRARDGKLAIDDLSGGTFTITNGGIYGSLMSTPIINPPQSAILGMHKIQKRPIVMQEGGKDVMVIRPMMYVALSYDHRIIDGKEAVSFLVRVKENIENPERLLLEV